MKLHFLLIWLTIPIAFGLVYPYVKDDSQYLEWLTIGLLIFVLFFSVVIHELCHGLAANWCGDPTAKKAGRLTLNPISHVSLFGSILVPLALYLTKVSLVFGWAKPVPFNPVNLRQHPRDQVMIAVAGPLSNFTLAYLFFNINLLVGLLFTRLYPHTPAPFILDILSPIALNDVPFEAVWFVLFKILSFGMIINVFLGVFNLIPFPPLDGSWILKALLPQKFSIYFGRIQIFGFILLLVALRFGLLEIFFYPAILIIGLFQVIAGFCLG